jgi:hypothetical protein
MANNNRYLQDLTIGIDHGLLAAKAWAAMIKKHGSPQNAARHFLKTLKLKKFTIIRQLAIIDKPRGMTAPTVIMDQDRRLARIQHPFRASCRRF